MSKRLHVLVVDDLRDWREMLSGLLADFGYNIQTAGTKAEARFLSSQQHFDVAILDVRLDETDENDKGGLELAQEFKQRYPEMPIIIITGYGSLDIVHRALQPDSSGDQLAIDFFSKDEVVGLSARMRALGLSNTPLPDRRLPILESGEEFELEVSLEPGQRPLVRGRGDLRFTYTSDNPLNLDPARFMRWGSERMMNSPDGRFLIKDVGRELYRLLFEQHPLLVNGYHRALGRVSQKQHLQLAFESTRELAGLPLEFLFSDVAGDFLALLHPMTRQVRGVETRRAPISAEYVERLTRSGQRLRMLLLVSNTEPRIDLIDTMGEELATLLSSMNWLSVDHIKTEAATYDTVCKLLRGCRYHIVQYIGHGGYHETSPENSALLFWERPNRSGNLVAVTANELRWLLENSSDTRLFHLTCCEGIRTGGLVDLLDDDYLGIGDGIVQSGVPAVLGYRWPVAAGSARQMVLAFYRSLLGHGSPELALLDARRDMASRNKDDLTWASPILISQR